MRLGADPEVFLVDQTNKPISSIGLIGGNKVHPWQIPDLPEGFTLQEDNVALEFGIPPAASADEFVHHIQTVLKEGLSKCKNLGFSKLSCTIFPEDQMQHPLAFEFGCEPDFNAWTEKVNEKPQPPHPFLRSAGGHVHIETRRKRVNVVRACDLYLGVPSVLMDYGFDRKQLYGKAGCFRPKPYGVEYRTLSNFWIFDPKLIRWVWNNTEQALNELDDRYEWTAIETRYGRMIQDCINNNDRSVAEKLVKEFKIDVC